MFQLEKEMTATIDESLDAFCKLIGMDSSQIAMAYELPVGYRIVDLVLAVVKEGMLPIGDPLLGSFRNLNGVDMEVLALFELYSSVSVHRINRELFMDWYCAKEILRKLERLGLVMQTSKFSYEATDWKIWCQIDLVSVELKLENWKEVLEQAQYNLRFSDYSFAVVDEDRVSDSTRITNPFRENNVGLVKMGSHSMKNVVKPSRNTRKKTRLSSVQKIRLYKDLARKGKWVIAE